MSVAQEIPAVFKIHTRENKVKSKEKGRPIFDDREICEMRIPGDRERVVVQPAHHVWKYDRGQPVTYAMRFSEQYRRFKEGHSQLTSGTPLTMLTEMPERKRLEYAALSVHTVEALANLEGQQLKTLGMGALEWKKAAQEYINRADSVKNAAHLSKENDDLKARLSALEAMLNQPPEDAPATDVVMSGPFAGKTASELKDFIAEKTGHRPKGNPSLTTLAENAALLVGEAA
jgi:hypothetical protein